MAQTAVTLNEIILAVRELTFDRFIIPAFAFKEMGEGYFLSVDKSWDSGITDAIKGRLIVVKKEENTEETIVAIPFHEYPTMEEIMGKLIESGIVVAYTPYFRGSEASTALITVTNKELTEDITLFRKYFFSDSEIIWMIGWYYYRVLRCPNADITDELIGKLKRPNERHMTIWVAYFLVEKRRLYENAANSIGQTFTDGSDYTGSSDASLGAGTKTTVEIGSVFSITEDPTEGYFYEDFNRVGSDNLFGDRYSFWYRLQLYLRDLLETEFGDYSLRKDNVIPGKVTLVRDLDFRAYYDSYPFTLSPLARGIVSNNP